MDIDNHIFVLFHCDKHYNINTPCVFVESNNRLIHLYSGCNIDSIPVHDKKVYSFFVEVYYGFCYDDSIEFGNIILDSYFKKINKYSIIKLYGNEYDIKFNVKNYEIINKSIYEPIIGTRRNYGTKYSIINGSFLSKYMIKYIVFEYPDIVYLIDANGNKIVKYIICINPKWNMNHYRMTIKFDVDTYGSIRFTDRIITKKITEMIRLRSLCLLERADVSDSENELIQLIVTKSPLWLFMMICKLLCFY